MEYRRFLKIIFLIALYFVSTYVLSILHFNRSTLVSQYPVIIYFVLATIYFVIGLLLFKNSSADSKNNSLFYVLSIISAILLFLPFVRMPKLAVYLLGIHIEIISGTTLGFCVSNIKK
jgi:hypothetical protein